MPHVKQTLNIRQWLATLAVLPLLAIACTADEATEEPGDDETPTTQPQNILPTARQNTTNLTSYNFFGDVVFNRPGEDGEDIEILEDNENAGEVTGEWARDTGWGAEITGFGMGTAVGEGVFAVSNGDRVFIRDSVDEPWREAEDPFGLEMPTPDKWMFVFDLPDLELVSEEPVVVDVGAAHHFSATRTRDAESLPPIFHQTTPTPGTPLPDTVAEIYDLYVSTETNQVIQLTVGVDFGGISQVTTWNFDNHNGPVDVVLPEQLAAQ